MPSNEHDAENNPASRLPSPPRLDDDLKRTICHHKTLHSVITHAGHYLTANQHAEPVSAPTFFDGWRLNFRGNFLSMRNGDRKAFTLQDIPARLLPFFAYKDAAIYWPLHGPGHPDMWPLSDAIYEEWFPTRDRTLFDQGILGGCGAPFFSTGINVKFADGSPPVHEALALLSCWHVILTQILQRRFPEFEHHRYGGLYYVRPGLSEQQLAALPSVGVHREYVPVLQRTFGQCFIWVHKGCEHEEVMLVVLDGDLGRRISSDESRALHQDVNLEQQVKISSIFDSSANTDISTENSGEGGWSFATENPGRVIPKDLTIWRGEIKDIMRTILAGDERRRVGMREFNPAVGEWLGEGELVLDSSSS